MDEINITTSESVENITVEVEEVAGPRGISVSNLSANNLGHLIITLSNGDIIDGGLLPTLPKLSVPFAATKSITIHYARDYAATYGQYPDVKIYQTDSNGNVHRLPDEPVFYILSGVISKIVYNLSLPYTGYIVLS